jgi:hypothetical protein
MQFSNPAGSARDAAAAYTANLLALLGDQDPYEVMEGLVPWLRQFLSDITPNVLRRPEAEGKWSILEVLGHLADTELVYGYRTRMILAHDRPSIEGYDQDRWARSLRYNTADPQETLAELDLMRRRNLRLLRSLGPEEMKRDGIHSERGPESVGQVLRLVAAHDLVHRRQMTRIRGAFRP